MPEHYIEELHGLLNEGFQRITKAAQDMVAAVEKIAAELPRVPEPTPERDTASEVAADLQRAATQQDILTPARVFSDPLTPPPADLRHVRDCHGDVWRRLPNDVWHTPETMPCGWPYMVKKWGPLVEVAPSEESR